MESPKTALLKLALRLSEGVLRFCKYTKSCLTNIT